MHTDKNARRAIPDRLLSLVNRPFPEEFLRARNYHERVARLASNGRLHVAIFSFSEIAAPFFRVIILDTDFGFKISMRHLFYENHCSRGGAYQPRVVRSARKIVQTNFEFRAFDSAAYRLDHELTVRIALSLSNWPR